MRYREERYKIWMENPQECQKDFDEFTLKGVLVKIPDGEVWKKRHMEKADHNLDFLRERASYGVTTMFEERIATIARKDAVEFVNKVKEVLAPY